MPVPLTMSGLNLGIGTYKVICTAALKMQLVALRV